MRTRHNLFLSRRHGSESFAIRAGVFLFALFLFGSCERSHEGVSARDEPATQSRREGLVRSGIVFRQACRLPVRYLSRLSEGTFRGRSPDVVAVPEPPNYFGSFGVTTHSGPWDYLQEIPLLLYGPGLIRPGNVDPVQPVTLADIAPTLGEIIGTPLGAKRAGRPIEGVLSSLNDQATPTLVVVVVWDGGGMNVLNQWPSAWPNLRRFTRHGVFVEGATAGSSPSVTPVIHANIGTGTLPSQHGLVDVYLRREGAVRTFSVEDDLRVQTLAEVHDRSVNNRAHVGLLTTNEWEQPLIGKGALTFGGDRDVAGFFTQSGTLRTIEKQFRLPEYLRHVPGLNEDIRSVDSMDGRLDGYWLGHDVEYPGETYHSPGWILYQGRLLEDLITRGHFGEDHIPDLLFTNFKIVDLFGHRYNMVNREVREALFLVDRELGRLVKTLNHRVGMHRWLLVLTADHGQTPTGAATGGWPIDPSETEKDLAEHFGLTAERTVEGARAGAFWLNRKSLKDHGLSARDVARFLIDYRVRDNLQAAPNVPDGYRLRPRRRLFMAAFPTRWIDQILDCAHDRAAQR